MSLPDVQMLDSELRTLIDNFTSKLNGIMSLPYESRVETFDKLQQQIKKINNLYHDLSVEVRLLDSAADQKAFGEKVESYNAKIKKLREEMTKKRSEIHSQQGGGGGGGGGATTNGSRSDNTINSSSNRNNDRDANEPTDNGRNPANREAHEVKDRISKTQNKTLSTLDDAERVLLSTEDTAAEATAKLKAQTEQMKKINEDMDQLDSEVERAKKELNAFIRRMMTDKILICFAILVILGIVLVVVFNFVIKKKDTGAADSVTVTTTTTAAAAFF
eukprot:GILI01008356.1.p1 GENE.GILI01008356.1~~GILI01008356.1.p1  ORF type:complete len:275 (-),score=65.76 GILI01008356.1:200-1024(-)